MTIRQFSSAVIEGLNSSNLDDYISEEYLYNIGLSTAKLLIKRETDSRKLFKMTSLFRSHPGCIEMETVNANSCFQDLSCKTIQKSIERLPEIFLTNFGSLIQVFSPNGDVEYKEMSPVQYRNLSFKKYKPRTVKYFWISDGYLYIPDSSVEAVNASYLAFNFGDEDYLSSSSDSPCSSFLESEFPMPGYMESTVIQQTIELVFNRKRINPDENPNLNNNEK